MCSAGCKKGTLLGLLLVGLSLLMVGLWLTMIVQMNKETYSIRQAAWLGVVYRAHLLPLSRESTFWNIVDRVLKIAYDLPLLVLGMHGNYGLVKQASGGLPAPMLASYVTFPHSEVAENLKAPRQLRCRCLGTERVHPRVFAPETLIFLDTGKRHTQLKTLIVDSVRGFHVNETSPEVRRQIQWMGEEPLDRKKAHSDDDILRYLVATMFFRMFGEPAKPEYVELFIRYMMWTPGWLFGDDIPNMLPFIPDTVEDIRLKALAIAKRTPGGKHVLEKIRDSNNQMEDCKRSGRSDCPEYIDPDDNLMQVVDGFLFAGLFGTSHLTLSAINRIRSDPAYYYPLYAENPHNFLLEVARLDPPVTSVTAVSEWESDVLLGTGLAARPDDPSGSRSGAVAVKFPKGSTFQLSITTANRDPDVFGANADFFDPRRPNLDLILTWNGIEKDVAARRAPRGCPGHDLAIDVTKTFVDYFASADMEPSDQVAPGDCFDFNACADEVRFDNTLVYQRYPKDIHWFTNVAFFLGSLLLLFLFADSFTWGATAFRPIAWAWRWLVLLQIPVVGGLYFQSPFTVHIASVTGQTWLLQIALITLLQGSLTSCRRPLDIALGLWFDGLLWGAWFLVSAFLTIGSFALGDYFLPSNETLVNVFSIVVLTLALLVLFFKTPSEERSLFYKPFAVIAGSAALFFVAPQLELPNSVAVLISLVGLFLLARLIQRLNELHTDGSFLATALVLIGFVVILFYATFAATSYMPKFQGNICGDTQSTNPLCTNSPVAQLDLHTRLMYWLTRQESDRLAKHHPPSSTSVGAPVRRSELAMIEVLPFGWYLPIEDEDIPHADTVDRLVEYLQDRVFHILPLQDDPLAFKSAEEARVIARLAAGHLADPVPQNIDLVSDEAATRWAFYGLGAHLVRRIDKHSLQGQGTHRASNEVFELDMRWMYTLDVRQPFERFGAAAYFDANKKIVRIAVKTGPDSETNVLPGQPGWEHAKFLWRSAILTGVTFKDHLCTVHFKYANVVVWAARETLSVIHPVRILLTPFTYRTIEINRGAASNLASPNGILHRATALSVKGLNDGFEAVLKSDYEFFAEQQIQQGLETEVPLVEDFKAYKEIVQKFVHNFLAIYFTSDEQVLNDQCLSRFIRHIESANIPLPKITSIQELEDVIAEYIVIVTAVHHHVGTVNEYVIDPAAATGKIRKDTNIADVQTTIQTLIIAIFTSFPQPKLIGDWTHILIRDDTFNQTSAVLSSFQQDLLRLSDVIQAKNANPSIRPYPVKSVDPRELLSSVSI